MSDSEYDSDIDYYSDNWSETCYYSGDEIPDTGDQSGYWVCSNNFPRAKYEWVPTDDSSESSES